MRFMMIIAAYIGRTTIVKNSLYTGSSDKRLRKRYFINTLWTYCVTGGGFAVIAAIVLIFFFLGYVVVPLLSQPSISVKTQTTIERLNNELVYMTTDEYNSKGVFIYADGAVVMRNLVTGVQESTQQLQIPIGSTIVSHARIADNADMHAIGLSNGAVLLFAIQFTIVYDAQQRTILPSIVYPYGDGLIQFDTATISSVNAHTEAGELLLVAVLDNGKIVVQRYNAQQPMFAGSITLELDKQQSFINRLNTEDVVFVGIDALKSWLYVVSNAGSVIEYDIRDIGNITINATVDLLPITAANFLVGKISLLVAQENGVVAQLFHAPVAGSSANKLQVIRTFATTDAAATILNSEYARKVFAVGDTSGSVSIIYAPSGELLLHEKISDAAIDDINFSPRGDALVATDANGQLFTVAIDNQYPEFSFTSLWNAIWYESYPEKDYVWQSSSASNDLEPKYSFVPLTIGTMKAALYAMLVAMPLAIMGAIYTAFFMSNHMRQWVKPTIEVMEALPTVILGFLAGLWLAPIVEDKLLGVLLLVILMLPIIIAGGWLWDNVVARAVKQEGFLANHKEVIMIPWVIAAVALIFSTQSTLEAVFFGGDFILWLADALGVDFDQRNALIVGLAMGFAVIPTIFSITEDAVFAVPKHLVNGSLALGATRWQSMIGVVLPTASPALFSAVMIGLGRAVGETMIVLMATGNTPIMDFNMFSGMRTLSANIAVEMPESALGSTHYRILFLSGLVLLVLTFALNTVAEVVRQRLRKKYSSL